MPVITRQLSHTGSEFLMSPDTSLVQKNRGGTSFLSLQLGLRAISQEIARTSKAYRYLNDYKPSIFRTGEDTGIFSGLQTTERNTKTSKI